MIIRFENFELDPAQRELRADGDIVAIEPKVFDLALYLASNADRVVSRDEVIAEVWDGRFVSDATVSSCLKAARKALKDDGKSQRLIRTVHGRGFRFVGGIEAPVSTTPISAPPQKHPGPSVQVHPLREPTGDQDLGHAADGLAEILTTALTRVPLLAVLSRTAQSNMAGDQITQGDRADRASPTYHVDGRLSRSGKNIRANIQLIQASSGVQSWAQQFAVDDTGDLDDKLLRAVLPRLETALVQRMVDDLRTIDGATGNRGKLIETMGILALKGWNRQSFTESADILREILADDPDQPMARAYLALILGLGSRVGILNKSKEVVADTIKEAERALAMAGNDSNVIGLAGCALSDIGQPTRAIPILRKAISLNPNNAQAWAALGAAHMLLVQYPEAMECLSRGIEISPLDARLAVWWAFLACASMLTGDLEKAQQQAEQGVEADDINHLPRVMLAAVQFEKNDRNAAIAALQDALRVRPDLTQRELVNLTGQRLGADLSALANELRP